MQLDYNTIKLITKGAVRIAQEDGFRFYRFTEKQEEQYSRYHSEFLDKTYSTTGVCMEFITDTCNLFMDVDFAESTSRKFYAFDIFCDGKMIADISNFHVGDTYFETEFSLENVRKNIVLGKGIKTVKIVFPWSVAPKINEICIDEGAMIEPTSAKDKMLFFGDSITQGYDAWHPSETYVYRIAERLGVEIYNKGIGGEGFFPELLEDQEDFEPKYISVAYGTNDWNGTTWESFQNNCSQFYRMLVQKYPSTRIFALTPIWRKDKDEERLMGDFKNVRNHIFSVAEEFQNVIPIDGYDFVPHDNDAYFSDLRLHPNSKGFEIYAENLYDSIKDYLQ